MDKRVVIVLVLVIVIVAGVGAALLLLNRQPASLPTPSATPIASPVSTTQTSPALTAVSSAPLTTDSQARIDVYLDAKATKMDGFQFIATLAGTTLPTVIDSDPVTEGVQIESALIPELSVSTNSVTEQDGGHVIRFAMISTDSAVGFSATSPVKVATILVSNGSAGSLSLTFNQQNSRARLAQGGDDALIDTSDVSLPVSAQAIGAIPATSSSTLVSMATTTTQTTPFASATPVASALPSQFCLASCFTDSDCAAGFACEADRCVNPACPTSQTCGCGAASLTTPAPTTKASIIPTITPIATMIPTPTEEPVTQVASSTADLPVSGSFEYTLLTLGVGLLLIGGGVFLTAKQTTE